MGMVVVSDDCVGGGGFVGCGGQKNVARRFLKKRGHEKPITLFFICDSGDGRVRSDITGHISQSISFF